ncbi:MAG: flagellar hook-associated protein FlgL [bacterium]|nr:flagellar hook-associated protein FlgL [bacterium]
MRVTNRMITDNVFRNSSAHLERLATLQNQLASGRRIEKPSDDPTGINQIMLLDSVLKDQQQYSRNIDQVVTWLDTTDSALGDAANIVQRARDLAVQGASDTSSRESRQALAREVLQIRDQLRGVANTQLAGRYIFAGSQTVTEPYPDKKPTTAEGKSKLDSEDRLGVAIGPGLSIEYNQTGPDVFGKYVDSVDSIFEDLGDLANILSLSDDTTYGKISDLIGNIDARLTAINDARADVGGKRNRVELLASRYNNLEVALKDLKSSYQDADIPALISDFTLTQQVYQSSLAASAKIMQPTLMDFLR